MKFKFKPQYKYFTFLVVSILTKASFAEVPQLAPQDNSLQSYKELTEELTIPNTENLSNNLPSEDVDTESAKKKSKLYFKQHPREFEKFLSLLLIQGNSEALKELLPVYKEVENYDPSVIDWGNAIISARAGDFESAVSLYRKLNSQLPKVNIIRFQMAMALYYNAQYDAAKLEFEKLRSSTESEADISVINKYLDAINSKDNWNVYASLSYINDPNITNAPKEGTSLEGDNGSIITSSSPQESGTGVNFFLNGDKKWRNDNKLFTALHLNGYGKYYWDNKKYNDITTGIGVGIGYQTPITEVELGPFYNKRWYGQGRSGDGDLHTYSDTKGVKLNLNQWFSQRFRYQGLLRYGKTDYIDQYDHNNGKDLLIANTALYFPNGQQFWSMGLDFSNKDADDNSLSYKRKGVRVGWGQTWPKGYSTKLDLGYATRDYEEEDFFGIKKENEEYNAGISFWKRDLTLFGLTPRFEIDYYDVKSNSPFEEYDKTNVSVELTKTF